MQTTVDGGRDRLFLLKAYYMSGAMLRASYLVMSFNLEPILATLYS